MTQKVEPGKGTQYTRKKIEAYSYGLLDQIGKGYSSKVYSGRHDDTYEKVAVKVIDLKLLKNDINRELLNSEIEILKELRETANILHLHDIFTTKNNTYIVTELCVSDLSKVIKKTLTEPEATGYMEAIIAGYLEVYRKGIVHRDLKPANILLTERNKIKIADFGFAVKIESLAKTSKYNVGSPLYMAPESLRKNDYSFKSDIWALGVIFYEMLFSETPWRAKNEKELLRKIEGEGIEHILENKVVNPAARQFLGKCLRIEKQGRMTPQELETFRLTVPSSKNILMEKIMNTAQKPTIPNDSLTLNNISCGNVGNRAEKSIDKNFTKRLITDKNENAEVKNIQNLKGPEIFETQKKMKTEPKLEKTENITKKLISKILISEVHFCRFLFKLFQRINESAKGGLLKDCPREVEEINRSFAGIIRHKVENLNSFKDYNYIKCEGYKSYKLTSDYEKLMKISKEYSDRYKAELEGYWSEPYQLSIDAIDRLIEALYHLLEQSVSRMQSPEEDIGVVSKDVVILDYLITTRQLMEIIRSNPQGYEKFARKSRIEEIVQGKIASIYFRLYSQIMERAKQSMEKDHFVSFGRELPNEPDSALA